jgi:folate-binding Fe-S cluster repair protein YgfZ
LKESNSKDQFSVVPNRGLIELEGVDTVKFLQGMVTNQMTKIERGGDGILAAFLTAQVSASSVATCDQCAVSIIYCIYAQGRVLFDTFIHPKNKGHDFPHPAFLVECDARVVEPLMKHLKRYLLRSKVKMVNVSNSYTVYQAWGPSANSIWGNYQKPDVFREVPLGGMLSKERFTDIGCKDPRLHDLGFRFVKAVEDKGKLRVFVV